MKMDFNFLVSYRMTNKQLSMKSKVSYLITAMVIIVIAVIAGASMILIGLNIKDSLYLTSLNTDIISLKRDAQEVIKMESQLSKINQKKKAIDGVNAEISLNRMVNEKELDTIYGALTDDVIVKSATYSKSFLVLQCIGSSKDSPSQCGENLHKVGITATIGYNGYSSPDKDKDAPIEPDGPADFMVTCILTPKGGDVK